MLASSLGVSPSSASSADRKRGEGNSEADIELERAKVSVSQVCCEGGPMHHLPLAAAQNRGIETTSSIADGRIGECSVLHA